MPNEVKKAPRPVLIEDRLIPRLVLALKEELTIEREGFDIASDTGDTEKETFFQERIKELNELLEAIGPEQCPYCDDNHGRTDGRGCRGCNLIALVDDDEVREIAREPVEYYDGRDGSLEQTDADRELTKGTPYEDA